jgi:hypothetical protein
VIAFAQAFQMTSFHSIGFPSEWKMRSAKSKVRKKVIVSIQLVSPASGKLL